MAQQINENMIREAAYFLWEKAGRPDGSAEYFWMKACEQFFKPKKVEIKKPVAKKAAVKEVDTKKAVVKKAVAKAPVKKAVVSAKKPVVKLSVKPAPKKATNTVKKVVIKVQTKPAVKAPAKKAEVPFYGSRR